MASIEKHARQVLEAGAVLDFVGNTTCERETVADADMVGSLTYVVSHMYHAIMLRRQCARIPHMRQLLPEVVVPDDLARAMLDQPLSSSDISVAELE